MNGPHFCETQVSFMVYLLAVVTMVVGATTFGAVISTLGRFLHAEVCEFNRRTNWTTKVLENCGSVIGIRK